MGQIIVICYNCKEEIYELKHMVKRGDDMDPDIFIPLHGYPQPKKYDDMDCPVCKKCFLVRDNHGNLSPEILTNKGIIP